MTEKEYQALHRKQMYNQIQRLRNEEHLSIQRIADRLGINFRTVKRYLEMSRSEFESFSDNITNKPQILMPYTDFVVERLSLYQDTSTAQMHDWLKEAYADFPKVTQRIVFNFVMKVRQDYNLPRIASNERQYNPMPDTPPGKYAQVDFGHKKLRTGSGQWIMVHFMATAPSTTGHTYRNSESTTSTGAAEQGPEANTDFHGTRELNPRPASTSCTQPYNQYRFFFNQPYASANLPK